MTSNEDVLYAEIGRRLRRRRVELSMTQEELAFLVGVLRTSITNLEKGRQRAPLHLLYQLCTALDLETMALLPSLSELARLAMVEVDTGDDVRAMPPHAAHFLRQLLDD